MLQLFWVRNLVSVNFKFEIVIFGSVYELDFRQSLVYSSEQLLLHGKLFYQKIFVFSVPNLHVTIDLIVRRIELCFQILLIRKRQQQSIQLFFTLYCLLDVISIWLCILLEFPCKFTNLQENPALERFVVSVFIFLDIGCEALDFVSQTSELIEKFLVNWVNVAFLKALCELS